MGIPVEHGAPCFRVQYYIFWCVTFSVWQDRFGGAYITGHPLFDTPIFSGIPFVPRTYTETVAPAQASGWVGYTEKQLTAVSTHNCYDIVTARRGDSRNSRFKVNMFKLEERPMPLPKHSVNTTVLRAEKPHTNLWVFSGLMLRTSFR